MSQRVIIHERYRSFPQLVLKTSRLPRIGMATLFAVLAALAACRPAATPAATPAVTPGAPPAAASTPRPDPPTAAPSAPAAVSSPASTPTTAPAPAGDGSPLRGVFEGITPCSGLTPALPQIPADSDCELMIWKFTLYQDPASGLPTTYTLSSAYGVSQPGTTGMVGGGTPIAMDGSWSIGSGARADPDAVVYQLETANAQRAVAFVQVSEDLLHVLDRDNGLMLGNASWSYTLNRTDNRPAADLSPPTGPDPEETRPPLPPTPTGASVLGVFEGRTPCHEIVFELTRTAPSAECFKVKFRLTLYRDPGTGEPSSYFLLGTRRFRAGTWAIVQGSASDPDAVVYQLQLDNGQQPVSFLLADENHLYLLDRELNLLVGNALFSYTVSRVELDRP